MFRSGFLDFMINATVKNESIEHVNNVLNSFHPNIQFTHEVEENNKISFLDILIIRNNNTLSTTVYRKPTNTDVYIHWKAFAPENWKIGTLRTLTKRAYTVCSNQTLLNEELRHLRKTFHELNDYPHHIINRIFGATKRNHANNTNTPTTASSQQQQENTLIDTNLLILPYKGKDGESILKDMKRSINSILPPSTSTKICFTSTKLAARFNIKDRTPTKHQNDIVYLAECPQPDCTSTYIGETARRLEERFKDHCGRDRNSHLFKHSIETGHPPTTLEDFKVVGQGFGNNWKRKLAEALIIKSRKPDLNIQEKSVAIKLLN